MIGLTPVFRQPWQRGPSFASNSMVWSAPSSPQRQPLFLSGPSKPAKPWLRPEAEEIAAGLIPNYISLLTPQ